MGEECGLADGDGMEEELGEDLGLVYVLAVAVALAEGLGLAE